MPITKEKLAELRELSKRIAAQIKSHNLTAKERQDFLLLVNKHLEG